MNFIELLNRYEKDERLLKMLLISPRKEIVKYVGIGDTGTFDRLIKRLGYVPRKGFRIINPPVEWDEFTAYFFGYMLGDGNLSKKGNVISIASVDIEHLNSINGKLSNGTVRIGVYSTKWNPQGRLAFVDNVWWEFLTSKGLIPAKSTKLLTLAYPPEEVLHHFVRGLFGSDGHIHCSRGQHEAQIKGTSCYIEELVRMIPTEGRIITDGALKAYTHTNLPEAIRFCEYLYKDATLSLDRKKRVYEEMVLKDYCAKPTRKTKTKAALEQFGSDMEFVSFCKFGTIKQVMQYAGVSESVANAVAKRLGRPNYGFGIGRRYDNKLIPKDYKPQ